MTKQIYSRVLATSIGAVALLALALAPPALAIGRHWEHHVLVTTPDHPVRWESHQQFSPYFPIRSGIYVDGKVIGTSPQGCRVIGFADHVAVRAATCQDGSSHLVVNAVSLDGKAHRITVVYRVLPQLYS